jgi:dTMP kinase
MSGNSKNGSEAKGKLIVIEGADASGKRTQAELLLTHLRDKGVDSEYIEFPQYDTPFGSLVAKYLRGELGELEGIPPEIPAMLFALDRYQFRHDIEEILAKGTYLIANRYIESNLGFQAAKFEGSEKAQFIKWLDKLEERLPQADIVFYLHLPVEHSQKLIAGREDKDYLQGRVKDIHEQDVEYQKKVAETYLEVARQRTDKWIVIECARDGDVKTREEVSKEIISKLDEAL